MQDLIDRLDPADMFGAVRAFPDHVREGWTRAADFIAAHRAADLRQVVIVGMGGSAIGGDLVRTYCRDTSPVPISVVRDYTLPASVGEGTLVIASSYSGGTEETLSAFDAARERGADIYVITSGGELQDRAERDGLPHVVIPGGLQPRAALGYSLGALLRMANKLGLCDVSDAEYTEALDVVDAGAAEYADTDGNEALDLARALEGTIPVVYTGPGLMQAVGVRWMNQIHENAKQLAFGNVFAELNHNEVMGWESAPDDLRGRLHVLVLRDAADHPQIQRRMDVTRDLLAGDAAGWTEISSRGESKLARMLSMIQHGDFVSYYLAMLVGVDPTPVETIQQLKRTLAEA
ncbi:MAG: bifunctional phosphoglucose/phosphomannose isomerase [Rhodothermales bacterium]